MKNMGSDRKDRSDRRKTGRDGKRFGKLAKIVRGLVEK